MRQKPQLSAHTEVRYSQEDDLLQHGISAKLMGVVNMQVHLFSAQGLQMHNVSNIQIEDPVVLLLRTQYGLNVAF